MGLGLLGCIVFRVLTQVSFVGGFSDSCRCFRALDGLKPVNFGHELVVAFL